VWQRDEKGTLELTERHEDGDNGVLRMLIPVDVPEWSSEEGLHYGTALARTTGAVVRLVHVRLWDPPVRGFGRFYLTTQDQATTVLENALDTVWEHDLKASGVVLDAPRANVALAIATEAEEWGADLVVMACRPRGFLSTMFRGDNLAQQVIRCTTTCPVVVAPSSHR
jgi:nucleotide-binding universal stress UspA family protein